MYVPLGVRSDHFQFANNDTQDNQLGFPQSALHFEWDLHCMETSQTEFAAVDCCKVSRTKSMEADIYFGMWTPLTTSIPTSVEECQPIIEIDLRTGAEEDIGYDIVKIYIEAIWYVHEHKPRVCKLISTLKHGQQLQF